MNKLYTDIFYIEAVNSLGEYLKDQYGLNNAQVQALKHKINNLVLEEVTE